MQWEVVCDCREEDLIEELMRSEREWGIARQQYQARMEQLQSELEETQRQLDTVKVRPCLGLRETLI